MVPLKQAIEAKHKLAERMPFNVRMFRGQLNKMEYGLYLQQQLSVFAAIESRALPHPDLSRVEKVRQDLEEISKDFSWEVLPSTLEYVEHIHSLSLDDLMPHVYLNYLAIMYGGQMMKKVVPSSGRMYEFDNMQEALMSIRNIQKDEWASEANKGLDYNIKVFEELELVTQNSEVYGMA
jgi:heme oxygenase